jgi:hypothetical protein
VRERSLIPRSLDAPGGSGHRLKAEDIEWMQRGRCRRYAADPAFLDAIMFPTTTARGTGSEHAAWVARRTCALCSVRPACLDHALMLEEDAYQLPRHHDATTSPELYGWWGGVSERERWATIGLPRSERREKLDRLFREKAKAVLLRDERPAA